MNLLEQAEKQMEIVDGIRKRFSDTSFPNVRRENLYFGMPKKDNYLEGHQVIMGGDNAIYSFVSDAYTLIRHEVVLDRVMKTLEAFPAKPNVRLFFPNNGAKMLIRVDFENESQKIAAKIGDKISPSIRIKNSYDKMWGLQIGFGARELVCSNGMTVFKETGFAKKKHMGFNINADLLFGDHKNNFLHNEITTFFDSFKDQLSLFSEWQKVTLQANDYEELKTKMPFSEKEHEHIEQMPLIGRKLTVNDMLKKNGLTLWEYNRAGTQYTTHELQDIKAVTYEEQIAKTLTNYYQEKVTVH